jgi:uncharacterized protein with FMN-binding domain
MNTPQPQPIFNVRRVIRRFLLSTIVIASFIAYALHKPFLNADESLNEPSISPKALVIQPTATPTPTPFAPASPTTFPAKNPALAYSAPTDSAASPPARIPSTPVPIALPSPAGVYKDGIYIGAEVAGFYGNVQVQAVIQRGKIADVQFLKYPRDRITSIRINQSAVPNLQHEVIRSQKAQVNIVTGATLTSQAFMYSLQSALDQATRG